MIEKLNYYATCSSEEYSKIPEWLGQFDSKHLAEILDILYREIFFKKYPEFESCYQTHLSRLRTHFKLYYEVINLNAEIKYRKKLMAYDDAKRIRRIILNDYEARKEDYVSKLTIDENDCESLIKRHRPALYFKDSTKIYKLETSRNKLLRKLNSPTGLKRPSKPEYKNINDITDIQLLSYMDKYTLSALIHETLVCFRKHDCAKLDCLWLFWMAKLCTSDVHNHTKNERPFSLNISSYSKLLAQREIKQQELNKLLKMRPSKKNI